MTDPATILNELLALPHETEWVEFKEARTSYDSSDFCCYVSALANEANLAQRPWAWLVFGIKDKHHTIVGTDYRRDAAKLDSLKGEIAQQLTDGHTIAAIHEVIRPEGRVLMFQIPPAPLGRPIAYLGHFYGRAGERLGALTLEEQDRIRCQTAEDWSAAICTSASLVDLDPTAVQAARAAFIARVQANQRSMVDAAAIWDDATLLDKAKLTIGGKITRTALLLLGRAEAAHHLTPALAQLTWKLEGEQQGYQHFAPPFLLSVEALYQRIRNLPQRIPILDRLVPVEVETYERRVVLEALHNAIAHQDYRLGGRVTVTERPDRLVFENLGGFYEGRVEDYCLHEQTPHRYRNAFLAQAMVTLNMIDTMGYGIQRMFSDQRRRGFPLPDYDLTDPERVRLTIHGQMIDPNYTALLLAQQDLPLSTVLILDRVQKRLKVDVDDLTRLRRQHLIEGRQPNVTVAARIASATGTEASYIRNRGLDTQHYKGLVLEVLRRFGEASRTKIDEVLMPKLPDLLSETEKRTRIRNLLNRMSKQDHTIVNAGSRAQPRWRLAAQADQHPTIKPPKGGMVRQDETRKDKRRLK